jgi:5-methylcytosine rRNA methyltransferase NSUN4
MHTYVTISGKDATQWYLTEGNHYDKVLVDAPCSSDRHVLHDPAEMAIWSAARSRLNAKRQLDILLSALRAVRIGGTVVYATCAMNQTENDDVIERAQRRSRVLFDVDTSKKWPVGEATKFGWIVLPDSGNQGWGPLYFAILKRTAGEREPANRRRELEEEEDEEDDLDDEDDAELGADDEEDEESE